MSITFSCPHCHKTYRVSERHAGSRGTCKVCGTRVRVPDAPSTPPPDVETSGSGGRVIRYNAPTRPPPITAEATPFLPQIEKHIERTIGPTPYVFHELVSPSVHIDLHLVPPTGRPPSPEHPFGTDHFTVVTSGMSSGPMNVPHGVRSPKFMELMVALPPDWPGLNSDGTTDQAVLGRENHWWPFRWLKQVARLPSTFNSNLDVLHTIPNGEGAEPFAPDTGLGCMMLVPPVLAPRSTTLVVNDNVTIHFLAMLPIYAGEMRFKLRWGGKKLMKRLTAAGVTELVDPSRLNVSDEL